jgi:hypothetical protein
LWQGERSGVTRKRKDSSSDEEPRSKRTLIPTFDREGLAKEVEDESRQSERREPFDPLSYARIVEGRVTDAGDRRVSPAPPAPLQAPAVPHEMAQEMESYGRALPATMPMRRVVRNDETPGNDEGVIPPPPPSQEDTAVDDTPSADAIGREMYGSYLASDFPDALVLAERLLVIQPDHALAKLVAERCRDRLTPNARTLNPASVLRLRISELERQAKHIDVASSLVLGHIDGVSNAATIASLSGLPHAQALDRLHALLDLGVLEVVSG